MAHRRRLRSQRVTTRRVVNAAAATAAAAFLCVGNRSSSVEAFCFSAVPSGAGAAGSPGTAARRWQCGGSTTTPVIQQQQQQQPHRQGFDVSCAYTPSSVWASRLGGGSGLAIGTSTFVSRTSSRRSSSSGSSSSGSAAVAAALAGRRSRSPARALGMAAEVLSSLGRDALIFLAATVAIVPACKKVNIRYPQIRPTST